MKYLFSVFLVLSFTLSWAQSSTPKVISSEGSVLSDGTTTDSFKCGSALKITHTIGAVAPESKTVSYGTVTSNLSGASKCWITQNLGATNQASSATDTTDASAGWYWQFNHKQGYMAGPIPAWTINDINENSDWLAAQDPCTIELGAGWRIPSQTEWRNADANGVSGGWDNYTETYADVLKLHASGYLDFGFGELLDRGTDAIIYGARGGYWSSTHGNNFVGSYFGIDSESCHMFNHSKACGFSLRCLRD